MGEGYDGCRRDWETSKLVKIITATSSSGEPDEQNIDVLQLNDLVIKRHHVAQKRNSIITIV